MTRLLSEIQATIFSCHGNITAPVDDDMLDILQLMCDWMAQIENGLGAVDAGTKRSQGEQK
jgi:hypothetical protein